MKRNLFLVLALASLLVSCNNKENQKNEPVDTPAPKQEVYQPQHHASTVDLKTARRYHYQDAPLNTPAASVTVNYDTKKPYVSPIKVVYTYSNGDTYTFTIPEDFGLWKNQAGKFRVVTDQTGTVWLQGQTKSGKRIEFVFYGDPANNGKKIRPNSVKGSIKYLDRK